jgi:hypothetical protein
MASCRREKLSRAPSCRRRGCEEHLGLRHCCEWLPGIIYLDFDVLLSE